MGTGGFDAHLGVYEGDEFHRPALVGGSGSFSSALATWSRTDIVGGDGFFGVARKRKLFVGLPHF